MKWKWIALLALVVPLAACGKKQGANDAMAGTRGGRDTTAMSGMTGMQGMQGMQGMEGMAGMKMPAVSAESAGVPLDRAEAARLGITFARAAERPVRPFVRAVGILKYAEPNRVYVNARVNGWVEKLYADYVGKPSCW